MARTTPFPGLVRLGSLNVFFATDEADGFAPGSVVIFRRNASKPSVYATIYEALRSRMEIMRRYGLRKEGGELAELGRIRETVREERAGLEAGDAGTVEAAFDGFGAALKRKSNTFKAQARNKAKAGVVRYPTEAVNRPATAARLIAIDRRIGFREEEVRSIVPWMGAMETALLLETRRSVEIVRGIARCGNAIMKHRLIRRGSAPDNQCVALAARLRLCAEDLATLRAAPFLGLACSLRDPMLSATLAAQSGTVATLEKSLGTVIAAAERQSARARVEAVLAMFAAGSRPSAVLKAAEGASRAVAAALAGRDAKAADLAVGSLRLAAKALKEGDPDAAKLRLKEAVASFNPV